MSSSRSSSSRSSCGSSPIGASLCSVSVTPIVQGVSCPSSSEAVSSGVVSSGVVSSGGTTTRGYSSLNCSSNIGEPWCHQSSSSASPASEAAASSLGLLPRLNRPDNRNHRLAIHATSRTPVTTSTTYPAGSVPSLVRARASAHAEGRASSGVPSSKMTAPGTPTSTTMASACRETVTGECLNADLRDGGSWAGLIASCRAHRGGWAQAGTLQDELHIQHLECAFSHMKLRWAGPVISG